MNLTEEKEALGEQFNKLLGESEIPWDRIEAVGLVEAAMRFMPSKAGPGTPQGAKAATIFVDTPWSKKARELGYVDLTVIGDVKRWKPRAIDELATELASILDTKPSAFIRDPNGVIEAAGINVQRIANEAHTKILLDLNSLVSVALPHDEAESEMYQRTLKLAEKAKVTAKKVQGRTAPGWRFDMTPPLPTLYKQAGSK